LAIHNRIGLARRTTICTLERKNSQFAHSVFGEIATVITHNYDHRDRWATEY
jgi:hypothetical protein